MKVLLVFVGFVVIAAADMLAGGWSAQDEKDPKWWEMLSGLEAAKNGLTATNFQIQAVRSQVVSGMNYEFTLVSQDGGTCIITVWEQAWLNKTEVTKDTCSSTLESKRQELGGVTPLTDFTEPGVKTCIGAMLDRVNAQENSMNRLVESRIINATRQVVAGWMYGFTMEVAPSVCMNNADSQGKTAEECAVDSNSMRNKPVYSARCWYKNWESPQTQILDFKMVRDSNSTNLLGSSGPGNFAASLAKLDFLVFLLSTSLFF